MAKGVDVITYLRPNGGWVISGDDYEGIQFLECEPFTKKEYTDTFANYDALIATEEAKKQIAKQELFARLGITEHEAKLLLA